MPFAPLACLSITADSVKSLGAVRPGFLPGLPGISGWLAICVGKRRADGRENLAAPPLTHAPDRGHWAEPICSGSRLPGSPFLLMGAYMISIFRGEASVVLVSDRGVYETTQFSFDALFQSSNPQSHVAQVLENLTPISSGGNLADGSRQEQPWLAPVGNQEIWAAGVTYYRSRTARMEESQKSGGDHFYDLVYDAPRPELFFKATAARARGHLAPVRIREDSTWDVPEPELTLAINADGKLFGYTIGNDMSSRSIEGENPLYLPQAKMYRGSCAVGPCLIVGEDAVNDSTRISIAIDRNGQVAFSGEIQVQQIKRTFSELAEFLYRENEFPNGAYLMTGTGIVPDAGFTLQSGDRIRIAIDGIGWLENPVQ